MICELMVAVWKILRQNMGTQSGCSFNFDILSVNTLSMLLKESANCMTWLTRKRGRNVYCWSQEVNRWDEALKSNTTNLF